MDLQNSPDHPGIVRYFDSVKPILGKYGLSLRATFSQFEVRSVDGGGLVANGNTIQWLDGFVRGLDHATSTMLQNQKECH